MMVNFLAYTPLFFLLRTHVNYFSEITYSFNDLSVLMLFLNK